MIVFKSELPSNLSAESRFIIGSITINFGGAALSAGPVNWSTVLERVAMHGLVPQIHKSVEAGMVRDVPKLGRHQLKKLFLANAVRNLLLARELASTIEILERAGIHSIALKGPVLGAFAFGDIMMRQSGDIDILVDVSDFGAAKEALVAERYQLASGKLQRPPAPMFLNRVRQECLISPSGNIVDLQFDLLPIAFPAVATVKELIDRSQLVVANKFSFRTLGLEDLLVYLCIHGSKHGWVSLRWIVDVAQLLVRHPDVDWDKALGLSENKSVRRMFVLGLRLASFLAPLQLPEEVVEMIKLDSTARRMTQAIMKRVPNLDGPSVPLFNDWFLPIAALRGFSERAKYLLDRSLHPTVHDWNLIPLPSVLYPLYFLVRPIRLCLEQGGRLLGPRKIEKPTRIAGT